MYENPVLIEEEFVLSEQDVLITRTDLSGRIVYANDAFLKRSGLAREEAVGTMHNVVRHPEVPAEVFRDLWETIGHDRPWTGVLKNRRGDGRFYWVVANVAPVFESGEKIGYMSVRTRPTPDQTERASELYAALNAPGATRLRLSGGDVVRNGALGIVDRVLRLPVDLRLWAMLALLALLFVLQALGARRALVPGLPEAWQAALLALLGIAVACVCGGYLTRQVLTPLKRINASALSVLCGHIQESFPERGDAQTKRLGRALNQMNAKLVGILLDAKISIDVIRDATQEFADGTADLANRTDEQASAIEQTTASLAEITETAEENARGAEHANATGQETAESAEVAAQEAHRTVEVMARVREHAQKIAEISSVIDSIAFQTNIIALNASVEAARAGQYGRGFAVVATEVRNLAQRAASAAKEIKTLIESSLDTVSAAAQTASRAGETMSTVERSVTRLTDTLRAIAQASRGQSAQIAQINDAVRQVAELTQRNAALVEQSAAASVGLRQQTQSLEATVSVFHLRGEPVAADVG